jgi:hypothetical protein
MPLKSDFSAVVGPQNCLDSPVARRIYPFDSSPFRTPPEVVVFPRSTLDVSRMLQLNAGIRQFGLDMVVRPPVELLAERAGVIQKQR